MNLQEIIKKLRKESKICDAVTIFNHPKPEFWINDYLARVFYENNDIKIPWRKVQKDPVFKETELGKLKKYNISDQGLEKFLSLEEKSSELIRRILFSRDMFLFEQEQINEQIEPDYLYVLDEFERRPIFFLGQVLEKEKINAVTVYCIGEELVSSYPLEEQAHYHPDMIEPKIVLREKPLRLFVWRRILDEINYPSSKVNKKIAEKIICPIIGKKPREIRQSDLEKVAPKLFQLLYLFNKAHELGHRKVEELFKESLIAVPDQYTKEFIKTTFETAADSIQQDKISGSLAYINEHFSYNEKLAMMPGLISPRTRLEFALKRELVFAYERLLHRDEREILETARSAIWKRCEKILNEINYWLKSRIIEVPKEAIYSNISDLRRKEEAEFEKIEPQLKETARKLIYN